MGAERNYCLAAEIVGIEEGVEDLGRGAPPDGITDKNSIITNFSAGILCGEIWPFLLDCLQQYLGFKTDSSILIGEVI